MGISNSALRLKRNFALCFLKTKMISVVQCKRRIQISDQFSGAIGLPAKDGFATTHITLRSWLGDNVFQNSRKSDWHFFSGLVLNPPLNISVEKTSSSAIMIKWLPPPGSLKDVKGYKVSKIYRCFYLFNYLFILKFIFLGYS